jgi:TonB-dependent starch-binding outer membrane protein SusC
MNKYLLTLPKHVTTLLVVMTLLANSAVVFAQSRAVTGTVTDGTAPLPGVSIVEKGTSNGTVTDADGKFQLTVGNDATLSISFIGMKPLEVVVGSQTDFNLKMESDISELDEIVIIGYGEVDRRDLASSVSSIQAKQLKDLPINSAAQALSGRLAGVQVTTAEGSPDADVQIRVRGGMSITGDNSPLYVVDGIQVENALSVLSPQDIEAISVLKDASATAIYGSRGANGVVIITTKSGKGGKTTVTYSGLFGIRQIAKKLDVWDPYNFVVYQYERSRGSSAAENTFRDRYGAYEDLGLYKGVPFVDWQDEVFGRDAFMQTHNFSINGGTEATSFNLSLTSNGEEGVMTGSDFNRKLINFKMNHKVSKRFDVGFNVRYNNTVVNGAGTAVQGSSSLNRLRHSVKYRPFLSAGQSVDSYDADYAQETNANSLALINPVLLTQAEYKQSKRNTANFSGNVKYKITDYISFTSTLGVDIYSQQDNVFNDTITSVSQSNGQGLPMASIDTDTRTILNNSNVLSFSSEQLKSFPSQHKVSVLLGQEIYETNLKTNFQDYRLFPVGITPELAFGTMQLGTAQPTSFTREAESKLLSFFGRASYSYNDKYFLTASMRADGSSKFAPENRWGYFPAASLMWRVSNENFMSNLSSTVSDLKLRASYGTSGNNRIDDYLYLSVFNASAFYGINNQQVIGFAPVSLANGLLKWEATISRNIGLDVGLFNNRVQFSVDAYQNSSKDLLLDRVVPSTSGYTTQTQNIGETLNKGIEVQVSGTPIDRGAFRWDVNFNISFNRNEIVSLGPGQTSFLTSSGWAGNNQPADYNAIVGQPVGTIWGLVTDGFYKIDDFDYEGGTGVYTLKAGVATNQGITSVAPQPGMIKFQDLDGNGLIDDNDRKVIGNTSPKFYGGLNQTFTYKNFDLSAFINFQFGNDVLNANKLEFSSGYTVNSNLLTAMDGRWRNVNNEGQVVTDPTALAALNANATIWSPLTTASSFYVHSWAVEDGSFVRINNLTLGYSLPASILSKVRISKFRIYGTVNNLAVFTNYTGYDPEANTRRNSPLTPGVDYAAYPRSRAYIMGVNLTF